MLRFLFVAILSLVLLLQKAKTDMVESSKAYKPTPQIILWAWDRPQFLNPHLPQQISIAFLHSSILLRGNSSEKSDSISSTSASSTSTTHLALKNRMHALVIPEKTLVIPVVHIDIDNLNPPKGLTTQQIEKIVDTVNQASKQSNSGWVQLDFEARPSQRKDYLEILQRLQPLRQQYKLSITALASWCMFDQWLDVALVDEVVPMIFRMGKGRDDVTNWVSTYGSFPLMSCNKSLGWMVGENWLPTKEMKRVYLFHSKFWTATQIEQALANIKNLSQH